MSWPTDEECAEVMAFLERSKDADMAVCALATGVPLYAVWAKPSRWRHLGDRYTILWCGEPTPETRRSAEGVIAKMAFDRIHEDIEHDPLPRALAP